MSVKTLKALERAAMRWAEFMELRLDRFKWSQPERRLYNAFTRHAASKRKLKGPR